MRGPTERSPTTATNTNTRRSVYINTAALAGPSLDPTAGFHQIRPPFHATLPHFLQKPQALPFLLCFLLILTWISFTIHHSSSSSSARLQRFPSPLTESTREADRMANLVRFSSSVPSPVAKDTRGWLLDPISLARASGILGGALTCASVHIGEIRPGRLRGNHRHHDCNETFVLWGALTKFRLENSEVTDTGYAEVIIGADDIVVAASPSNTAHALVNIDPVRSTFFIGCQDNTINYNASSTDFNVWKDL
ncbi:hypothetical protein HN51_040939 [Arachis hypogaea]|uniref:Cupin type-1 domain-containing protein n=1 Tax=Arachis hypogaea TaxID=3818 RepID=A0A444YQC9_ARAHY|nr:uncharacterized protein LOC107604729 [Arachis ipaensis]XP_025658178.1 uncharacterized protein LOC112754682 [Arachis hypogaea]QHN86605.1 uncharacterized protein DS421_16g547720 [Arachis hypogaea]QHN86606.1 uncharacterized protein DS421_16g547720 [Arachis hypogaea]RYR04164.1 hypothetical protein Ahy_B06g083753 [Arachis hypogaea]